MEDIEVQETEVEVKTIEKNRNIFISGISMQSALEVCRQVTTWNIEDRENVQKYANYTPNPITLNIMSYGGDVYALKAIISCLRNCTAPIITYARGAVMSAGFLLFLFGAVRIADRYATFMFHDLSAGSFGTMEDLKNDVKQCEVLTEEMIEIVVALTKIKKKDLLKRVSGKNLDWFMNAQEALELGVATQVV